MTEEDKCKELIDKISNILEGESVEDGLKALMWVMANVVVHAADKEHVMQVSAKMVTEFLSTVLFLLEEEEEETMQ
jgi:hypothetical protein